MERTVYARRGLRLAPWYGFLVFLWGWAVVLSLVLVGLLVGNKSWSLDRLLVIPALVAVVVSMVRAGLSGCREIRTLSRYALVLDDNGVTVDLPGAEGVRIPWCDVRGVVTEKVQVEGAGDYRQHYTQESHTLRTARGDYHFCSGEIPAARRAADEIAARARIS